MPTTVVAPSDLYFYIPSRGYYALSWKINPALGETINLYDFEVQTDSVSTFDSANLKSYTSNNVLAYQNGSFFKAFVFTQQSSLDDYSLYFRVRVQGFYASVWSASLQFDMDKVTWHSDSELLKELVPDKNIYNKDGLLNSYKVIEAYCREVQNLKQESNVVNDAASFAKLQDSDLEDVLGAYLEYTRNTSKAIIEYRRELLELWDSYLLSGTVSGVKSFVGSVMGYEPDVAIFTDFHGWLVFDEQDLPWSFVTDAWLYDDSHFFIYDPTWTSLSPTLRPNSSGDKGFSWILKIYNPFNLATRHTYIEEVVNKLKPANTKVYFEYYYLNIYPRYWGDTKYWGNTSYWQLPATEVWSQYYPTD